MCVGDTLGDRSSWGPRRENCIIEAGKMAQRLRVLNDLAENSSLVPSTHVRSQLPVPPAPEGSIAFGFSGQHCTDLHIPTHRYTPN